MSFQLGLGYSEDDIEVQGEIDFDFFDDSKEVNGHVNKGKIEKEVAKTVVSSGSSVNSRAPLIKVSSEKGDGTKASGAFSIETVIPSQENHHGQNSGASAAGAFTIETVIPSPEDYYGNSCENPKTSAYSSKEKPKANRVAALLSEQDVDESSVSSSLSTSDSELATSFDDDSFDKTDSMTDVSPLPSHCHSPLVAPDVTDNGACLVPSKDQMTLKIPSKSLLGQKERDVTACSSSCRDNACRDEPVDVEKLLKAMKQLEVKQKKATTRNDTPFQTRNSMHRKNMTFTNEEVRRIDQENKRLLKKIVSHQIRPKPHFSPVYSSRPSSSGINRQRWQRQIELDNLALLKRLEATKPSQDLCRNRLLNDYKQRSCVTSRASTRPTSRLSSQQNQSTRNSAHELGRSCSSNSHTSSWASSSSSRESQLRNAKSSKSSDVISNSVKK